MKLSIHGQEVPVAFAAGLDAEKLAPLVEKFVPLQAWQKELDPSLAIKSAEIQSVDLFGPRVGFIKMKFTVVDMQTGRPVPGIVFFRGDAVAILPLIKVEGDHETFVLLTEQFRVPLGRKLLEIPAGMCDGDGNFSGVAIKELEEETGLKLKRDQLVDLGRMVPSAGGCDEKIQLFGLQISMGKAELDSMMQKIYGEGEHETIRLRCIPLKETLALEDAKLLAALARWHAHAQKK